MKFSDMVKNAQANKKVISVRNKSTHHNNVVKQLEKMKIAHEKHIKGK